MAAVEKPLSINQKILMECAGKQAMSDWQHNLGNTRLLASRVLIAQMIRIGDEDVLSEVANYFGVQIIKSKDVLAKQAEWKKAGFDYTYEQVEKALFERMTEAAKRKAERQNARV